MRSSGHWRGIFSSWTTIVSKSPFLRQIALLLVVSLGEPYFHIFLLLWRQPEILAVSDSTPHIDFVSPFTIIFFCLIREIKNSTPTLRRRPRRGPGTVSRSAIMFGGTSVRRNDASSSGELCLSSNSVAILTATGVVVPKRAAL